MPRENWDATTEAEYEVIAKKAESHKTVYATFDMERYLGWVQDQTPACVNRIRKMSTRAANKLARAIRSIERFSDKEFRNEP